MSLLLFLPTENKEINKGLYSGTSSFSVSADSISPNRAVRYVHLSDGWCTQSIYPPRPLSLTDTEMSHLRCTVAGCSALLHQRQGGRARGRGPLCVEGLAVKPITFLWTNWASLIDQWTGHGGGVIPQIFPPLWFILSRKYAVLFAQNSLCIIYKTSIPTYGGLFIWGSLYVVNGQTCPKACMPCMFFIDRQCTRVCACLTKECVAALCVPLSLWPQQSGTIKF